MASSPPVSIDVMHSSVMVFPGSLIKDFFLFLSILRLSLSLLTLFV